MAISGDVCPGHGRCPEGDPQRLGRRRRPS